jgi:hypothetical protein
MNTLRLCDAIDFIARFKPTLHPENADLMVLDLRLPRDAMQDVCLALTESGIRYCFANGGTVLWFDRRTWEVLQQQSATHLLSAHMAAVA